MQTRALDLVRESSRVLASVGIPEAAREAVLIVRHAASIETAALYRDNPLIDDETAARIAKIVARRARREPLHYILGRIGFHGLDLVIGPGVLIPRPETELLVEEAVALVSTLPAPRILDLCTGSGAVALAIAKAVPHAHVVGADASPEAIALARENARALAIENLEIRQGDLYAPVAGERFDLIVSNPPYIESAAVAGLQPEIALYEPRAALDGGPDGLVFYRRIMAGVAEHLTKRGAIALELGAGQAGAVAGIVEAALPGAIVSLRRDWAGHDRILTARMSG